MKRFLLFLCLFITICRITSDAGTPQRERKAEVFNHQNAGDYSAGTVNFNNTLLAFSQPGGGTFEPNFVLYPPPIADFSVSDSIICTGDCIDFTDLSTDNPTNWNWTFNSATPSSSSSQNPNTICYNSPGTYVVELVASNSLGSDTAKMNIVITGPPNQNVLRFQRAIGDAKDEGIRSVRQTYDGGYIMVGLYDFSGGGVFDAYAVKTDGAGNVQWSKTYGVGTGKETFYNVRQTLDSGYLMNGYITYSTNYTDGYVVKTDANGNLQWSRFLGSIAPNTYDDVEGGQQTADSGYIVGGSCYLTANLYEMFLAKLDSTGNLQWSKAYGGTANESGWNVQQTSDHGYILVGHTASFGAGLEDVYLVKTDSAGNLLWTKTYGGAGDDEGRAVQQTSDGGYIITGHNGSGGGEVLLIKTNSIGDTLWTRNFTSGFTGFSVQQTRDGDYIVFARSKSNGNDAYLIKTDNNGKLLWAKTYGGSGEEYGNSGTETSDGGYALCGWTNTYGNGGYDAYFIKTDNMGNSGCHEASITPTVGSGLVVDSGGTAKTSGILTIPVTVVASPLMIDSIICIDSASIQTGYAMCKGDTISMNASLGAYSYSWAPATGLSSTTIANPQVFPTATTTYTLTVSNSSCFITKNITVNVTPLPSLTITGDSIICYGSVATLSASGGVTYSWNTGDTSALISVVPTSTTAYTVTGSDSVGCSDKKSITVTVDTLVTASVFGDTLICQGQNALLFASGGNTYLWSTGASTAFISTSPMADSTYFVIAINGACADTATINVKVDSTVTALVSSDTTICRGLNVTLTAGGGITYTWSPPTGLSTTTGTTVTATPTATTTYTVIVSLSQGACADTADVTITVDSLAASVSNDTTICQPQNIVLTASGGTSYLWNTGATTNSISVSPSTTTSYTVVITDGTCSNTKTVTINVSPVNAVISGGNNVCPGGSVTLVASAPGGTNFLWDTGATTASITVTPSSPSTTYSVLVTNGSCGDTASKTIIISPPPIANAGSDTTILISKSTVLNGSGGTTYNWNPATHLSCTNCPNPVASPITTTTYVLTVTDNNGCTGTDSVTVFVEVKCGEVFVPNAFSPNGDRQNDVLYVRGNCIATMIFRIYDRWGELVFESDDVKQGWDGSYRGGPMNTAVFVYSLEAIMVNGDSESKKGSIHLVK